MDGQHATFSDPNWVSHLTWTSIRFARFPIRAGFSIQFFVSGENNKAIFSVPSDTIKTKILSDKSTLLLQKPFDNRQLTKLTDKIVVDLLN